MDRVFIITTPAKTYPASNVRTFEDKGRQMIAAIYKGTVSTFPAADVTAIAFDVPPAPPPPPPEGLAAAA